MPIDCATRSLSFLQLLIANALSPGWRSSRLNSARPDLAQAIGIKGMSQEDADADEGEEGCYDLDHSFPPCVEMPGRALLMNSR